MTSSASASGTSKIVLFQGAASFGALIDTYVQRLSSRNMLHRLRKPTYPTEFIMMRGPGGKGHAQVAIAGRPSTDDIDSASRIHSAVNSPVMSPKHQAVSNLMSAGANNGINSSRIPGMASPPLAPHAIPGSAVNSTPSSPSLSAWFKKISLPSIAENLSQATSPPPPPKALQASMTFVSIPWQSIIDDLIGFKRQLD
ncbi:hypothetical protein EC988_008667 [Linderina pennispora]|nr:hypothetical protein EC988_008667 [Linderina pennispora]